MKLVTFLCLFATFPAVALAGPHDVYGLWQTQSGNAHVNIDDCGDGTPCGTIVWVELPEGGSGLDERNPDPALQNRTITGLTMLTEFAEGGSSWKSGKIYDPESGKTYRSNIRQKPDGTLQVKGCIGPLCQSQVWIRIDSTDD